MKRRVSQSDIDTPRNSEDEPGCSPAAVRYPAYNASPESSAAGSGLSNWLDPLTLYRFEDWSMLSNSNSNLGPLTDSTDKFARYTESPERISCLLDITFEKQKIANPPNAMLLQVNDPSSYSEIDRATKACVRERFEPQLADKSLNYRNGECTIIGDNGDKHIHGLSSQEEWKDICNIVKVCISNRRFSFHLRIKRDFFGLSTRRDDEDSFASLKRMEIFRSMRTAFDGRRYIALTDLSRITSTEAVQQILEEAPIPELKPCQQKAFVHHVLLSGRKLLAMCIYAQLRMTCLKKLMDKGHDDNSLLTTPLVDDDFCHEKCQPSFAALVQWQGGFTAAEFLISGQNQFLSPSTVVPIHYHPNQTDTVHAFNEVLSTKIEVKGVRNDDHAISRQNAFCGSGAYSNVYRVKIDPAHHMLSKVGRE